MSRFKLFTPLLWLLALLLAAWIFAQLPLATITQTIAALSWFQLVYWLGLNLVIILLCNRRWQLLNNVFGMYPGFGRLLLIRQAGQAVSFITPGPQFGGEPLQIYWLYRLCNLPLGKTILALGLDRFLELWINFSVLLLGLLIVLVYSAQELTGWPELIGVLLLLVALMFAMLWVLLRQPLWLGKKLQVLAQRWHQHPRLLLLESGFQAMGEQLRTAVRTQKAGLLQALLLSLVSWAMLLLDLWLVLRFAGINADLSAFLLVLVSMRLSMLLPLPGGIGTLEAALLWSLHSLGHPASAALGVIALMRMRDALVLGGSLWCLRLVQLRYKDTSNTKDSHLLTDGVLPG